MKCATMSCHSDMPSYRDKNILVYNSVTKMTEFFNLVLYGGRVKEKREE